uniref:Beta-galactosidase n=1 Tax=Acrobeloides nanus TaxID=290746 RepID=A0A914CGF1_9BILA
MPILQSNNNGTMEGGLHDKVALENTLLQNWYACGINLTKAAVDSLATSFLNNPEVIQPEVAGTLSAPGVYIGQFTSNPIQDTFFNSTGWTKGQLFVNGYNLGRYWPVAGPQTTLYVPKPYIQETNTVLLIELVGTTQNTVSFIDTPSTGFE